MNVLDAAYDILKSTGIPMTAQELMKSILEVGCWKTTGKTPERSLGARIYMDIKNNGSHSRFVKLGKGKFALSGVSVCSCDKLIQGDLFNSDYPLEMAGNAPKDETMFTKSKFYEPALVILKSEPGKRFSANEVKKQILIQYPDLQWSGSQGPIRAMLLSASNRSTPIKLVEGSKPPLFYYDETNEGNIVDSDKPNASPEEIIESAMNEADMVLKDELIEKVREMDDSVFEELVNRLIERLGFGNHVTTPRSHDGGIDGMIFGDSLGLNVVCVQAKHYIGHNVERQEIDAFIGALEGRNGVFVTTSDFSKGAKERAEHNRSSSRIALIDGNKLVDLMFKYNMGVQETDKRFVIKRIDNDFFEDLEG